ncbi:MAG: hypothetical protein QXM83_03875, partial [Ignisphaera sp.]
LDRFDIKIEPEKMTIYVELPREIYLDRELQLVKALIAEEVYKYVSNYNTVVYIEKYTKTG